MEKTSLPESLMGKLSKLLALRDGTDNPAEAANAAARISELLTKYNLELSDIKNPNDEPKVEMEEIDLNQFQSKTDGDYARDLFIILTNAYYCKPILMMRSRHKYDQNGLAIIGRPSNVKTVIFTGTQLINRLDIMESDAWRTDKDYTELKRNPYKRAYLRGAVQGIKEFLRQQRKAEIEKAEEEQRKNAPERKTHTSNGDTNPSNPVMALVKVTNREIEDFIQERMGKTQSGKLGQRELRGEAEAGNKGYRDGYRMGIHGGLNGGSHKGIIGN